MAQNFKNIVNKYKKYYNKINIRKKLMDKQQYKLLQICRPYCKNCGKFYTGIGDMCIITDDICLWV
jgi:hypothetical protein